MIITSQLASYNATSHFFTQVMRSGQAVELNSPLILLQNKKSHFFMMVAKTGPEASRKLYEMALEADQKRSIGYGDESELHSITLFETAC